MHTSNTKALSIRQRCGYTTVKFLARLQAVVYTYIIRDLVWRSADGRVTPIRKMTTTHLDNAYRMVCRQRGQSLVETVLRAELVRRGCLRAELVRRECLRTTYAHEKRTRRTPVQVDLG